MHLVRVTLCKNYAAKTRRVGGNARGYLSAHLQSALHCKASTRCGSAAYTWDDLNVISHQELAERAIRALTWRKARGKTPISRLVELLLMHANIVYRAGAPP